MKIYALIFSGLVATTAFSTSLDVPDVELKVRVIEESGNPISGATVGASFPQRYGAGAPYQGEQKEAKTDQDGVAELKARTASVVSYGAFLQGYYRTANLKVDFMRMQREGQPLKVERDVLLKKVMNPIPMYARHFNNKVPVINSAIGYDLIVADWVPPYGKGTVTDIFFNLSGTISSTTDYAATMTITFPNKGDGIIPFQAPKFSGSELRSNHLAPSDGYQGTKTINRSRKPEQMSKDWINETRADGNYYFRVRTVLDKNGNIISALYGKIYGDFEFWIGYGKQTSSFRAESYYLNPTANDRNVEFDPNRNLFTNLKSDEQVAAP